MSDNLENRLFIWIQSLRKSYYFLCINESSDYGNLDISVELDGIHQFSKDSIIKESLIISSIICFLQLFNSGNGGEGFICNSSNEIKNIRNELKKYSSNKLGLSFDEYDLLIDRIKYIRDGFVAHYDGDKANYKEINPFIISFQMCGPGNLDNDEINKFKQLIEVTHNFLTEYIKINHT